MQALLLLGGYGTAAFSFFRAVALICHEIVSFRRAPIARIFTPKYFGISSLEQLRFVNVAPSQTG